MNQKQRDKIHEKWQVLALFLILVASCAPNTLGSKIEITRTTDSDAISSVLSISEESYKKLPSLNEPLTDILVNTGWTLERSIVNGDETTEFTGRPWLQLSERDWIGFNGCNRVSGAYKAGEKGAFAINIGIETLVDCRVVHENGEVSSNADPWFNNTLSQVVAYEVKQNSLWLYFSDDKNNALVFLSEFLPEE